MIRAKERKIPAVPEAMAEGARAEAGLEVEEGEDTEGGEAGMAEKATNSGRRCANS